MPFPKRRVGLQHGFRSGLEEKISDQLTEAGIPVLFETEKIEYITPAEPHKYTPDFKLPNGIIIETKGRFLPADRKKHRLVKAQHPDKDIRFVFTNSNQKISKASKTTYASWCEKYGFQFADKWIPESWLREKTKRRKVA